MPLDKKFTVEFMLQNSPFFCLVIDSIELPN